MTDLYVTARLRLQGSYIADQLNLPADLPGCYGLYCVTTDKWYIGKTQRSVKKRIQEQMKGLK